MCVYVREREREELGPCITHTGVLHAGGQQEAGSGLPVCDTQAWMAELSPAVELNTRMGT